jgi:hypothetical protein
LVGAVGIESTIQKIRLVPSIRCSRLPQPIGTNGTNDYLLVPNWIRGAGKPY